MLSTTCTKDMMRRKAPLPLSETDGEPAILVVEDDSSIRNLIRILLQHTLAASVVDVADPFAALSAVRSSASPIELLISDINLSSSMNGIDLASQLAAANPSMKVLLMSGTDRPPSEISRTWRFVSKPFRIESFLDCVLGLWSPSPSLLRSPRHTVHIQPAARGLAAANLLTVQRGSPLVKRRAHISDRDNTP